MDIKTYFEKHSNGTLSDAEWEQLAQTMIQDKFDQEKKAQWTEQLKADGIYRSAAETADVHANNSWKWLGAVMALLLLGAATWYIFLHKPLPPAQKMASAYLEKPFRLDPGSTRGGESVEINRGKAYEAYDTKQYEKSLAYLRTIEASGEAKPADYFQMGLCLMYQKTPDYPKAINAFNTAHQQDPTALTDEINWFTALCQLMTGDETSAKTSLQKVVDSPSSRNKDAAMQLLRELK